MSPLLAAISAQSLVMAVITIIAIGLICWLLIYLIGYAGVPEPFNKIARVLVMVVAVVFLINALLTLVGRPFITW